MRTAIALLLLLALSWSAFAQDLPQSIPPLEPAAASERQVSWTSLVPNILEDQKQMWLFPTRLGSKRRWIPAAAVLGATIGLVALDPHDAPYFRRTTSFKGFNRVFSSSNTSYATIAAPLSMYAVGLIRKDSKLQQTALFAGEAVADAEVLTTVMKDVDRRLRPHDVPPGGNFSDTWFEGKGSFWRGRGSMPSGHTIAAFSVATVIARRHGNHRWVPYVAYGAAAVLGFSRVTTNSHFVSDVFLGGALGYSIGRFTVLRQ